MQPKHERAGFRDLLDTCCRVWGYRLVPSGSDYISIEKVDTIEDNPVPWSFDEEEDDGQQAISAGAPVKRKPWMRPEWLLPPKARVGHLFTPHGTAGASTKVTKDFSGGSEEAPPVRPSGRRGHREDDIINAIDAGHSPTPRHAVWWDPE
jgi:hypothetical protein